MLPGSKQQDISKVRVLVGARKVAFVLTSNGKRELMTRVILPPHLRTQAQARGDVEIEVEQCSTCGRNPGLK